MEGTPSGAVKNSKWVFEEEGGGRRKESVVSVCVRVCLHDSTLWMDVSVQVGIGMRTVSKPSECTSGTNASVMDCVVFGLMMRIDLWKRELMAVILAGVFFSQQKLWLTVQ